MSNGIKGQLEVWLDFAKQLIWPIFILILVTKYGSSVSSQIKNMIEQLQHNGGEVSVGPEGVKVKLLAETLRRDVAEESKPNSPTDPVPSPRAIAQVQVLNTIQSIAQNSTVTGFGWLYCGVMKDGKWEKKPNLDAKGQALVVNQTYPITTDTYLRDAPPEGDTPKGQVIGVVPEGQDVLVSEIRQVPNRDPNDPNSVLIWAKIENKSFYGLGKN